MRYEKMQRLEPDQKTPARLDIKLPHYLKDWLECHCEYANMTKSDFIRELIEDVMNEELN
jgi:predicted DNA-binding protein